MKQRIPKKGEIWRDERGPFLVTQEHSLAPWDKRVGYVCAIGIIDMMDGTTTNYWAISNIMLDDMTFVS